MWIDHLFCNEQSSHTRSDTFSWLHILPWQTQKILHRPKSFIPNGSLSIKLRFWSLTAKSYESELQQQEPLSSIVFRLYRIAQTPMLNGRPSKMLWRASAFSRGTILGFLIGKRSKNHAAMW